MGESKGSGAAKAGPLSILSHLLANPPTEGGRNNWLAKVAGHYAKELKHQDAFEETIRGLASRLVLRMRRSKKLIKSIWTAEQSKKAAAHTAPGGGALIDVTIEPREILAQTLASIVEAERPAEHLRP